MSIKGIWQFVSGENRVQKGSSNFIKLAHERGLALGSANIKIGVELSRFPLFDEVACSNSFPVRPY